jgi:hypothetical protein
MDDLLAPLAPPAADAARPGGLLRGAEGWRVALDGAAAGLEVWMPVGPALLGGGRGTLCEIGGRMLLLMTFDLGPAPSARRVVEEDGDGED